MILIFFLNDPHLQVVTNTHPIFNPLYKIILWHPKTHHQHGGYYMQLFLFHGSVNCYHLEEHFMDHVGEVEFWHP